MIDVRTLRNLAFFYTNTNRWDLEEAGIIAKGPSGDTYWARFNHDFDIFILKLSDENLEKLAAMANRYADPFKGEPPALASSLQGPNTQGGRS